MRSAAERGVRPEDLTGQARLRDAAVRCFGREGFDVPVRVIAAEAGVSPALVIHHFGSKDGLRSACDEHVLRVVREAKADALVTARPGDLVDQLAAVDEHAPLAAYVVQALLAGGPLAAAFLDSMVADTEEYLREAVDAGRVRPSRDPRGRAQFLVHASVGALLVHLRHSPPVDGDLRGTLRAYRLATALPALELYTEGLLTDRDLLDAYLQQFPPSAPGEEA